MSAGSQKGGALIFVSIVGLVASLMLAMFLNNAVVVEERAVEAELARSRVYWAQMGAFNYALSRISSDSLCDAITCILLKGKDTDKAQVLGAYLLELTNNRSWTYADEAAGYSFTTANVAAADDNPGRQTWSGWLMATASFTTSTLLSQSAGSLPTLQMRVCVGLASGGQCGFIAVNNGGNYTPYFSINRLTNLPS